MLNFLYIFYILYAMTDVRFLLRFCTHDDSLCSIFATVLLPVFNVVIRAVVLSRFCCYNVTSDHA